MDRPSETEPLHASLPSSHVPRALALTAVALVPFQPAQAQQATPAPTADAAQAEPFKLPELGYSYDALAPIIDAKTMELHHSSTIRRSSRP